MVWDSGSSIHDQLKWYEKNITVIDVHGHSAQISVAVIQEFKRCLLSDNWFWLEYMYSCRVPPVIRVHMLDVWCASFTGIGVLTRDCERYQWGIVAVSRPTHRASWSDRQTDKHGYLLGSDKIASKSSAYRTPVSAGHGRGIPSSQNGSVNNNNMMVDIKESVDGGTIGINHCRVLRPPSGM